MRFMTSAQPVTINTCRPESCAGSNNNGSNSSSNSGTTVAAVYEGVNELESSGIVPSLHHRKKGWLRHQKISRSHRNRRSRGGFPFVSIGKPPRLRSQRMLRNIFLIAQPSLVAVMQGGD